MKLNILIILFLFPLLFTRLLLGQGNYLERGQSGIGFGAYYSSSKDYSTMSGSAGYSISDIIDLGISIGKVYYDRKFATEEISAVELSPHIEIQAFKQDKDMPLSIALFASYDYHSYLSDALLLRNLQMSAYGFSTGLSVYITITTPHSLKIQPSVGAVYSSGKIELSDDYGNSISNKGEGCYYRLGMSFFDQLSPTTIFKIDPVVFFHPDYTTFGISAGIVIILQD